MILRRHFYGFRNCVTSFMVDPQVSIVYRTRHFKKVCFNACHKVTGACLRTLGLFVTCIKKKDSSLFSCRSVRVWLLRDSGQYWPSVCHYMGAAATALHYVHQDNKRVFVGLENGVISVKEVTPQKLLYVEHLKNTFTLITFFSHVQEFTLSEDYNHMQHVRDYHAHQVNHNSDDILFCVNSVGFSV
jgi:hypothetical protein